MKKNIILTILIVIFSLLAVFSWAAGNKPVLREKARVFIDGVEETWLLEWKGPTLPACSPDESDWYTCPCIGFAFGEAGNLELVRKRPGHSDERLNLTPLFEYGEAPGPNSDKTWAVLRRWDMHADDQNKMDSSTLPIEVKNRPIARIMKFGDYDHDGRASEFLLQIGTMPCGKSMTIAVGISKKNPHLHAFTSFKNSGKPLILRTEQWESLRNTTASLTSLQWLCGDHASNEETEYVLQAKNGTIRATRRVYTCTSDGKRGALFAEEEF